MINKKTISGLVSALTLAVVPIKAENTGWVSATFKNNYIASGSVLNDTSVLQTDIGINLPKGTSLDLWSNYVFNERKHNEHDLTLSLPRTKIGKSELSASVGYWFLGEFNIDDMKVASANLSLPLPFSPAVNVLYGNSKEFNGFNGSLGLSHNIRITENLSAKLGFDIGAEGKLFTDKTGINYLAGSASLTYNHKNKSVSLSLRNQQPTDNFRKEGYDNKTTLSFGVNYNF